MFGHVGPELPGGRRQLPLEVELEQFARVVRRESGMDGDAGRLTLPQRLQVAEPLGDAGATLLGPLGQSLIVTCWVGHDFPVAVRHGRVDPLAPRGAAVAAGPRGGRPALVQEHQPRGVDDGELLPPGGALGLQVGPVLLGGPLRFFFECSPAAAAPGRPPQCGTRPRWPRPSS
jgi:hypothetical protein